MRRGILFLLACACAAFSSSCTRDEIHVLKNNYHINYIFHDDMPYCKPAETELMWLRFYDPDSGKRIREMYAYPQGTDLNMNAGTYTFVVHSHENTATKITYPEDLNLITAETETLSETPYRIIQAPSHVYVAVQKDVFVPSVTEEDSVYTMDVDLYSPMDSWRVVVTGVKNLDLCRSVALYVTNQYEDILLGDMVREGAAVMAAAGSVCDTNVVVEFATFGMVPDAKIEMQIYLTDAAGQGYRKTVDVTEQVNDPANTDHAVTFDFPCEMRTMEQGGLQPDTDEWDAETERWTLQ